MSDSIEWTHAGNGFTLIGLDEEIGGYTSDDDMETEGNYGLAMGQCCLYGQPEELLQILSEMKSAIISRCIDDGRVEPADEAPEPRFTDAEAGAEVPF